MAFCTGCASCAQEFALDMTTLVLWACQGFVHQWAFLGGCGGGGEVVLHCPMSSCSMSYICKSIPPKEICPSQKQMQGKYIRFCFMEQEICTLGCQFDAMVVVAQMWCCHTWCNGAACTCLPTWQLIGL